jgi:FKBP-type peptidyl-prolyl cis-trans isomerase
MKTRTLLILLATCFSVVIGLSNANAGEEKATASGLKYEVLRAGTAGTNPAKGDVVVVHYTGTFDNGEVFDTSVKRGQPFRFPLGQGQVISGWDEGVELMTVGSKFRFHVPWALAYGAKGRGKIGHKGSVARGCRIGEVGTWMAYTRGRCGQGSP